MSDRRLLGRLALVAVSAAALTACAVAMLAGASGTRQPARQSGAPAVLAQPARPDDPVPGRSQLEQSGIEPSSARYAGADEEGSYWLASDGAANVCLVAQMRGDGAASACVSRATFAARGISLGMTGSTTDQHCEVYAIPDDIDVRLVAQRAGLHIVSANVLTGDSTVAGGKHYTFASNDKRDPSGFLFTVLPAG